MVEFVDKLASIAILILVIKTILKLMSASCMANNSNPGMHEVRGVSNKLKILRATLEIFGKIIKITVNFRNFS